MTFRDHIIKAAAKAYEQGFVGPTAHEHLAPLLLALADVAATAAELRDCGGNMNVWPAYELRLYEALARLSAVVGGKND